MWQFLLTAETNLPTGDNKSIINLFISSYTPILHLPTPELLHIHSVKYLIILVLKLMIGFHIVTVKVLTPSISVHVHMFFFFLFSLPNDKLIHSQLK